ncbi:6-phosphofructo-2-kinase/fructose-2,6-bisphosphatase-like protein [Gossypium australe]|uniref:6-phosphofructo-2-kinase/fructose-2, 6-bisphosphatase-like protein n=1 Tax=Gossypium australe TaxID=47621 RepID=A0A5B6UYM1_9ROSI|nr:6-phosphofructo-2-kinase/fructose-2,6-bisphosphatase-like protein [Gossypium australe]
MLQALAQYWNLAYSFFTIGKVDLVPTVEEYTTLLLCPRIQADKAYSRVTNVPAFLKKLISITRISEHWVATWIKQKRDSKCIPWKSLQDLIFAHPDKKKKVDVFALNIYMLVIFPKSAKAHRSLSTSRRAGEGRFIGCAQLLLAWFHSHFCKVEKVSYRVFSENYSLLKEFVATPRRDNNLRENGWQFSRVSKKKTLNEGPLG